MVSEFVLASALRMGRTQLLAGAAEASRVVLHSYSDAVSTGEIAPLRALHEAGSLDSRLYNHLSNEVCRGHEMGEAQRMANVVAEQMRHVECTPKLESLRLIVGCHREGFDGAGLSRLAIGSTIVVVGAPDVWLWRQGVQQDLMREHGCSVHVQVKFDVGPSGSTTHAQLYTFEAAVGGAQLCGEDMFTVPMESEEAPTSDVDFALVDLNGILDGNEFWRTAEEARGFFGRG